MLKVKAIFPSLPRKSMHLYTLNFILLAVENTQAAYCTTMKSLEHSRIKKISFTSINIDRMSRLFMYANEKLRTKNDVYTRSSYGVSNNSGNFNRNNDFRKFFFRFFIHHIFLSPLSGI